MALYSRLNFTYTSKLVSCVCVCVCVEYVQQTSWIKGTLLSDRDTATFIRLKVTEISMFYI